MLIQMDNRPPRDQHFVVDLETGHSTQEQPTPEQTKLDETLMRLTINDPLTVKVVIDTKVDGKEKRTKPLSAKKPPKPPRPTKGFSLDAADQKLIKELTELAKIKRASIERMKAAKQKKALTASSSSSSMNGSLFATLFTIIFFLMMFFQGMSCRSSGVVSPQTAQTNENGLVFIQEQLNPSASDSVLPHSKSSNLFGKIPGSSLARRKVE